MSKLVYSETRLYEAFQTAQLVSSMEIGTRYLFDMRDFRDELRSKNLSLPYTPEITSYFKDYFKKDETFDPTFIIEIVNVNTGNFEFLSSGFFNISSYRGTELITLPWHELFDWGVHLDKVLTMVKESFLSKGPYWNPLNNVSTTEKKGGKFKLNLNYKLSTPLLNSDNTVSEYICNVCEIISVEKKTLHLVVSGQEVQRSY